MRSYHAASGGGSRLRRSTSSRPAALLATLIAAGPFAQAAQAADENEIPFDVANVFFELNNTDGEELESLSLVTT